MKKPVSPSPVSLSRQRRFLPVYSGDQPGLMQWLLNLVQPRPGKSGKIARHETRQQWLARQSRPTDADMSEARAMWQDGFDTHEIARELGFPEVFIYNRLRVGS